MSRTRKALALLVILSTALVIATPAMVKNMENGIPKNRIIGNDMQLFDPHMPEFICQMESKGVPPIDAQADDWLREALALESAEIYVDDRDYRKIVQLTRQAAQRRHWKAMLNLASLYLEGRDTAHGVRDAIRLVEESMSLGVPAAYDRMGTYFSNGTGVRPNATAAYAYWQKAARMGNPQAMAFLAEKLSAGVDGALPGYWANIPVAMKMLECAVAQGYGPAADSLSYLSKSPRDEKGVEIGDATSETNTRALNLLQTGVRYGCSDCAHELAMQFASPISLDDMMVPHIDKARAKRYRVIGEALSFDPSDRFPNLDKVLPLPPARLPPWNGDRDTLLWAARGVTPPPAVPAASAASQRTGRYFLDAAYALRATSETARGKAPFEGYWQPTAPGQPDDVRKELAAIPPGLYSKGEPFRVLYNPSTRLPVPDVIWHYHVTIAHNDGAVYPRAPKGMLREVARPQPWRSARSDERCPVSGAWQPWVSSDHPLQSLINRPSMQAWVVKGQAFPHPRRGWHLPLDGQEVSWHLMDDSGPEVIDVDVNR